VHPGQRTDRRAETGKLHRRKPAPPVRHASPNPTTTGTANGPGQSGVVSKTTS
jgi:hypothetical protein